MCAYERFFFLFTLGNRRPPSMYISLDLESVAIFAVLKGCIIQVLKIYDRKYHKKVIENSEEIYNKLQDLRHFLCVGRKPEQNHENRGNTNNKKRLWVKNWFSFCGTYSPVVQRLVALSESLLTMNSPSPFPYCRNKANLVSRKHGCFALLVSVSR